MEALSSSWGVLKDKPKALFRRASKRDKREMEMETSVTPFPYSLNPKPFALASQVSLTPTSQWSPVSATFTDTDRPHVLVKRSKSSVNRDGERQARPRFRPLVEEEGERRSKILSVIVFPLTRRKSKSQLRTPSPTSSDSDSSSISSRSSRPTTPSPSSATPPALRRSASVGASHRVHPKYDQLDLPPPPVPKIPSPTSDTWAKLPKRSQSQSKRERPRPIVANVEGYWDHLDLLDYQNHEYPKIQKRGRDPPFPTTPQTPVQRVPVPF